MRLRVTWQKTPAAFLMLKKTGEMRLYGGGGSVGGMMTEDVNKERLASGAAAGFFCVCLCRPEEKATGRR